MCGRYLFDPLTGELATFYRLALQYGDVKSGEVFPSEEVVNLGITPSGKVKAAFTRWGFTGFKKSQLIINARSETVLEKPFFAEDFRQSRCIFPMTGFYEWNNEKERFLFTPPDDKPLYVAGFYRMHEGQAESIILTTKPNSIVKPIHDRMPLILKEEEVRRWLSDLDFASELLERRMTDDLVVIS